MSYTNKNTKSNPIKQSTMEAQNYDTSKWISQMCETKKQVKQFKQMVKWEGAVEAVIIIQKKAEINSWGDVGMRIISFNKSIQFGRFENNKLTHEGYCWKYETNKKFADPTFIVYDPIKRRDDEKRKRNEEKERKKKAKERENSRITVKSFLGGESFEMKRVKLYQKRVEEEWRVLKSKREERRRKGIMSNYNRKKQKRRRR